MFIIVAVTNEKRTKELNASITAKLGPGSEKICMVVTFFYIFSEMDSNSEMIGELDALSEYLNRHTTNILKAFDSLEKDIPLASQSRKKIFIEKTTAVLRNLNLIDQDSNLNLT